MAAESKTIEDIRGVGDKAARKARVENCLYEICFARAAAMGTGKIRYHLHIKRHNDLSLQL